MGNIDPFNKAKPRPIAKVTREKALGLANRFSDKSIGYDEKADAAEDRGEEHSHRTRAMHYANASEYLEKRYGAGHDMTAHGEGKKYGEK